MNKKILMIIILMGVLIPINTEALTGSVNLNCETTTLKTGESTDCNIEGNINEEVSAISIKLEVGDNLTLSNIETDPAWQGNGIEGDIQLYTDINKTGNFKIATFTVKAESIISGSNTSITLSNIFLSDKEFYETSFTVEPLSIRIPSTINTLKNLTYDGTSISGFSADKTSYSLLVDSNKSSINIDGLITDSYSTIAGDIGEKTLKYGINNFNINVTSESGNLKTYYLTVTRPDVRELKTLNINNENIQLISGIYEYKYTVGNEITAVNLKAELSNPEESSFVDEFGIRKLENLKIGDNEVLIKIKNNSNEELTYKIIVKRLSKEENDATIDKNPNTWNDIGYSIFLLVTIIGCLALFLIRKCSKFPKKV